MRIASGSQVYVKMPVYGPAGVDVTQYTPVKVALVKPGTEPLAADLHTGLWLAGEAALLIGGTGQVYPAGDYMAFVQVPAGAEIPLLPAGRVSIGLGDT